MSLGFIAFAAGIFDGRVVGLVPCHSHVVTRVDTTNRTAPFASVVVSVDD